MYAEKQNKESIVMPLVQQLVTRRLGQLPERHSLAVASVDPYTLGPFQQGIQKMLESSRNH